MNIIPVRPQIYEVLFPVVLAVTVLVTSLKSKMGVTITVLIVPFHLREVEVVMVAYSLWLNRLRRLYG